MYHSSWYVGKEKFERESLRQLYTWKDKRCSSGAFSWDNIDRLEKKLKESTDDKDKSINDQSLRGAKLLPDEDKEGVPG